MVFLNMGFDISSLVLLLVSYFSVTATMVCVGNHWDGVYHHTGQVRHANRVPCFRVPLLVSYFSVTVTMVCVGNHWDGVYKRRSRIWVRGGPVEF